MRPRSEYADSAAGVARVSATMLAAALVAIAGPELAGDVAGLVRPRCLLSGALLAIGAAVPLLSLAPAGWALGVVAGCGWAVSAATLTAQHRPRRAAQSGRPGGLNSNLRALRRSFAAMN